MNHKIIFEASDLPVLQNRVYNTPAEAAACDKGDVRLVRDHASGLVFNIAYCPEKVEYDRNYQNEQGCSAVFTRHLHEVARIVEKHAPGKTFLEVGCGKGTFTEMLRARGMDVTGLDPAYEGQAPYIIKKLFSPSLGLTGDVVVLRHVLEHIARPFEFLKKIAEANDGKGLIYIEVPCLDWIIDNHAWYDIFYEHVNYFRLSDFNHFFKNIRDSGRLFGGQYIFVVADLASLGMNFAANDNRFSMPSNFFSGIDEAVRIVTQTADSRHVVWGAASKGVLFALHLQRHGCLLNFAIDINPAKQNKYLPVTGLPVLSPESASEELRPGDIIFVMNPNYLDEIRQQGGSNYEYFLP